MTTKNTKIIIVLAVAGGLIVFGTNFLPDLIQEESGKTVSSGYHYETSFQIGRQSQPSNQKSMASMLSVGGDEQFITSNPVDLSQINRISKFRSCIGHDYSGTNSEGQQESNRSMKHYVEPINSLAGTSGKLQVFAPFDGKITQAKSEGRGQQVWISTSNGWHFIFFHIDLLEQFSDGSSVNSGEHIGYANLLMGAANFDIGLKQFGPGKQVFNSPFLYMDSTVLDEYLEKGLTPEDVIISKFERDSNPCNFAEESYDEREFVELI